MVDEQPHLFDDRADRADRVDRVLDHHLPLSEQPNPMIRVHGDGPPGYRCGDCVNLVWKGGHSRRYYGCEKRGAFTNGPATDHLTRWPACGLFVFDDRA